MRMALAQINPTVGDFRGNVNLMTAAAREANSHGAEVVVFPELSLAGYPPRDLVAVQHLEHPRRRADRGVLRVAPRRDCVWRRLGRDVHPRNRQVRPPGPRLDELGDGDSLIHRRNRKQKITADGFLGFRERPIRHVLVLAGDNFDLALQRIAASAFAFVL